MARRYGLRDDQWVKIEPLLPGRETVGVTAKDHRLFVEAVWYRYRAGIPWRDVPERFGDFRVIHTRPTRWSQRGVWKRVFERLADDPDNEDAMIDSTIIRAHQHRAGATGGTGRRNVSGAQTADWPRTSMPGAMRWVIRRGVHLTRGQAHDLEGADVLLPGMTADTLSADKAFDVDERVIEPLRKAGKAIVIPPKSNRKVPGPMMKTCTRRGI